MRWLLLISFAVSAGATIGAWLWLGPDSWLFGTGIVWAAVKIAICLFWFVCWMRVSMYASARLLAGPGDASDEQ